MSEEKYTYETARQDAVNVCSNIYVDKIKELESRLKECESVVEFYGNTNSWDETPNRNNLYQIIKHDVSDDYEEGLRFGGKRAREYQARYKTQEKKDSKN